MAPATVAATDPLLGHHLTCWCGRDDWRVCFRTSRFALLRCGCEAYRIDPPPLTSDCESQAFYTAYYQDPIEPAAAPVAGYRTYRFWQVARQVPAVGRVGERAADIGCGEGHLCADLRDAGWPVVTGIDVAYSRIQRARQLYPHIEFHDRPLRAAGLPEKSFDLMVMDNVIEHLLEPHVMVRDLHGYLKSDGRLVVITPNMESGYFRVLGRFWTPELAPHVHIYLFTGAVLCRLLARAGFAVEAAGSFHVRPHSWRGVFVDLRSGAWRRALWHAMQQAGDAYGRLIGAGPMLYAVARPEPPGADGLT